MLKAFLADYQPHRTLLLVDVACAILSGLLELGFPMAIKVFVDVLLPRQGWQLIVLAALGLGLVYVANAGLMVVVTYWGHVLGINIETECPTAAEIARLRRELDRTRMERGVLKKAIGIFAEMPK